MKHHVKRIGVGLLFVAMFSIPMFIPHFLAILTTAGVVGIVIGITWLIGGEFVH